MAKTAQATEPSMEEILASIRRIISDEENTAAKPASAADPSAAVSPIRRPAAEAAFDRQWKAEAADLDQAAADAEDAPTADESGQEFEEDGEDEDGAAAALSAGPAAVEPAGIVPSMVKERAAGPASTATATPSQPISVQDPRLLSPSTDAIVSDAFNQLANTMLASQSRTLEDIVQDLMRPMLRAWLDDNLPTMVERLVREEIERVSRGPRR